MIDLRFCFVWIIPLDKILQPVEQLQWDSSVFNLEKFI